MMRGLIAQRRIAQAKAFQIAGRKRFDDEVSLGHQLTEQVPPVSRLQVECDAPLVGVVGKPVETLLTAGDIAIERTDVSGRIAAGRLDLDYVCTKVAQRLAADQALLIGKVQYSIGAEHGLPIVAFCVVHAHPFCHQRSPVFKPRGQRMTRLIQGTVLAGAGTSRISRMVRTRSLRPF
jgi:hypothetical protein